MDFSVALSNFSFLVGILIDLLENLKTFKILTKVKSNLPDKEEIQSYHLICGWYHFRILYIKRLIRLLKFIAEAYLDLCQTSMMQFFAKTMVKSKRF